jgi:curved DNA-binding protein CbpA
MDPGITFYDVLGAVPDAETRKLKQKYQDKAALLRPELVCGAPPDVLKAVTRAQQMLDTAWEVLGDPGGLQAASPWRERAGKPEPDAFPGRGHHANTRRSVHRRERDNIACAARISG